MAAIRLLAVATWAALSRTEAKRQGTVRDRKGYHFRVAWSARMPTIWPESPT